MSRRTITVPDDLAAITTDATPGGAGSDVEQIWDAVARFYRTGLQPAIALCLRQHGEIILDRAIGHARGNGPDDAPGAPRALATPDTSFCIFSASEAVTAILRHHLDDQGAIHIDDRVAEYIPEFAAHGKGDTTIRHVLTHRAGIPSLGPPHNDVENLLRWDKVVRLLCEAKPATRPAASWPTTPSPAASCSARSCAGSPGAASATTCATRCWPRWASRA